MRLQQYQMLPSRKSSIFLFDLGLDPDKYATSISLVQVRKELNLVEVEVDVNNSITARVDKSLLTCRFNSQGQIAATGEEIVRDAKEYCKGITSRDYDAEVLLCGRFTYTRVVRAAEQPLIRD